MLLKEKHAECNIVESSVSVSGLSVSTVILLINELGHGGQLNICRAFINGACARRQSKALE